MTSPENFLAKLHRSLVETGVNPYRASLLANFVTQCYDVLLSAHHALVQPIRWQQFCTTPGATTKRKRATAVPANISETAITAHLSTEANRLLQERGGVAALVPGISIACVIPDHTAPSDVATGSSSKRPDLVFFPANPTLQLQFAMEAKIVRLAKDIANDLLGEAGFGCFVRAIDPYETNGVIGLLGYVEPTQIIAMMNETKNCMKADERFTEVGEQDLIVNADGLNHRSHTVVGHIAQAGAKVCIANMLAVELTTL
ncbi:hypothetical protein [Pseudomonas sp. MWU13-2100]|uniref:hypothetical protein n=1 Tax=Pseudomonas sp. MWU13-2100 TaxID=2935075 RepID=UPI00200E987F|nr:hypothetical protein [Pseudomonas sp. MWU13-2100]